MTSYRVQVYSRCKIKLSWVTVPLQCRGQSFLGYEAATRFSSGLWIHIPHRALGDKTEKMEKKKDVFISIQSHTRYLLRHPHPPRPPPPAAPPPPPTASQSQKDSHFLEYFTPVCPSLPCSNLKSVLVSVKWGRLNSQQYIQSEGRLKRSTRTSLEPIHLPQ